MRKYVESKTTRIMMVTVPHVTSGSGLRKFQADGFLLDKVYNMQIRLHVLLCRAWNLACQVLRWQTLKPFEKGRREYIYTQDRGSETRLSRTNLYKFIKYL